MDINASKVGVGGLAAGIVANIVGFVAFGMLLGKRIDAEAVAVAPSLSGFAASSHIDWLLVGMMTPATYAMASVAALIQVFLAAWVGGMIYKEA